MIPNKKNLTKVMSHKQITKTKISSQNTSVNLNQADKKRTLSGQRKPPINRSQTLAKGSLTKIQESRQSNTPESKKPPHRSEKMELMSQSSQKSILSHRSSSKSPSKKSILFNKSADRKKQKSKLSMGFIGT